MEKILRLLRIFVPTRRRAPPGRRRSARHVPRPKSQNTGIDYIMGMFSLTQELAIDLGTANTLIIYNGKVVVDEPSIVALDVHTGRLVAIGHQARQMHEIGRAHV